MLSASRCGGGVTGEKADLGTIPSHDCGNKIQIFLWGNLNTSSHVYVVQRFYGKT